MAMDSSSGIVGDDDDDNKEVLSDVLEILYLEVTILGEQKA